MTTAPVTLLEKKILSSSTMPMTRAGRGAVRRRRRAFPKPASGPRRCWRGIMPRGNAARDEDKPAPVDALGRYLPVVEDAQAGDEEGHEAEQGHENLQEP